jgi:hypothetical protein
MHTILPQSCEQALLERFLKAEAMALWAVQSAQVQQIHDVPPHVLPFLRRHEEDEAAHLQEFERRLAVPPRERRQLPRVPRHWSALAVHLLGYEALGLEFAKLLAQVQPDLRSILEDELIHVAFLRRRSHNFFIQVDLWPKALESRREPGGAGCPAHLIGILKERA